MDLKINTDGFPEAIENVVVATMPGFMQVTTTIRGKKTVTMVKYDVEVSIACLARIAALDAFNKSMREKTDYVGSSDDNVST